MPLLPHYEYFCNYSTSNYCISNSNSIINYVNSNNYTTIYVYGILQAITNSMHRLKTTFSNNETTAAATVTLTSAAATVTLTFYNNIGAKSNNCIGESHMDN